MQNRHSLHSPSFEFDKNWGYPYAAGGEATSDRRAVQGGTATGATGHLYLTYFTATRSETINNLRIWTYSTAAVGGTLVKLAAYSVATNGDLTLVASTANDASMFSSTFTAYNKPLIAPWNKVARQTYAVGYIFVGSGTGPTVLSCTSASFANMDTLLSYEPRYSGAASGLSDLPASLSAVDIINTRRMAFVECLP